VVNVGAFVTANVSMRSERCHQSGWSAIPMAVMMVLVNALAEAISLLYQAELIWGTDDQGRWRNAEEVELAAFGWVYWFTTTRIHSYLEEASPDEFEAAFYAANKADQHQVGIH
jgi:hypothetical protein